MVKLLGLLLFLVGIGLLGFIYLPVAIQEVRYALPHTQATEIAETPEEIAKAKSADPEFAKTTIIPVNFDFSLVIPQIGVNSTVFANIDSGNQDEYLPILKQGVAHAQGSSLPNQSGPVFIFAHSTDTFYNISRYNATFFLLNKLNGGESIFIFYEDRKYEYKVSSKAVVDAEDIPYEVNSHLENGLILQTCYPPGTTLKRLLVFAKLVD